MTDSTRRINAAEVADALRDRLALQAPVAGLVLGSGLGGLAERIQDARRVAYREIPGFAPTTVAGHAGELIAGTLGGREVIALAGRFHLYEGHEAHETGFPVRLLRALGAGVLVLSNAAGGVRRTFRPGDLMVINDHINLSWQNPLLGPVVDGDVRFADMSEPYDAELRERLHAVGHEHGIPLHDGVYAWLQGPVYETPAEVRMLERMGIDAVGMSTVPEVLVARASGMRVVAVSCITNPAAGMSFERVDHEDVLRVTQQAAAAFETLVTEFVRGFPG